MLGSSAVNEMRFQFMRAESSQIANSMSPAILVAGSFNGGGAQVGHSFNTQKDFEFQNYTSIARGVHSVRFGARVRGAIVDNTSPQNFTGTFNFGGSLGPALDANNQPVLMPPASPLQDHPVHRAISTNAIFQQRTAGGAIRTLRRRATQFSINAGNPAISGSQVDVGVFVGDDWHVRPNLSLSLGLRYETQSNIHDWRDVAPRIGLAWAPGASAKRSRPKTVVRAGFGTFYDRFSLLNTLAAERYNGIVQQQYVVTNPDFFPMIPTVASLAGFQ